MHRNQYTSEQAYSLDEAAHVMSKSRADIEGLIRQKRLGFEMSDYGPVITNRHIASYYIGERPRSLPDYQPKGLRRKPRKRYPKARSQR
jgi:hypothetical protein